MPTPASCTRREGRRSAVITSAVAPTADALRVAGQTSTAPMAQSSPTDDAGRDRGVLRRYDSAMMRTTRSVT